MTHDDDQKPPLTREDSTRYDNPVAEEPEATYPLADGKPMMLRSVVCFADILGYRGMTAEALQNGTGNKFLQKIHTALASVYSALRERGEGIKGGAPVFQVKVFTDNVVVGYPFFDLPEEDDGEFEIGDMLILFTEFQSALVYEGFMIRGGIAVGDHYMDEDVVFGDALIEAASHDERGGPPRLLLSEDTQKMVKDHMDFYDNPRESPQNKMLLKDADGRVFLNYLFTAFELLPEGGIMFDLVEAHRDIIETGLKKFRGVPDTRAKFEWAARYHNFVCNEYLESYPPPEDFSSMSDADAEHWMIVEDVQQLEDYLVDIEGLAAAPSRLV